MVESASGETVQAAIFTRGTLPPGTALAGPAAIVEAGTTTIIPSGFTARIAHGGEIIIEGDAA
jgi:N-methylhydantoinase A